MVGRKLRKDISVVDKTDSSNRGRIVLNPEKYPTYIEYVPIKKSLSMKNLLDRKAFSNPDSSANIQVLQKVLRKQASPEFRRKFSSNPKLAIKNVPEVPQRFK